MPNAWAIRPGAHHRRALRRALRLAGDVVFSAAAASEPRPTTTPASALPSALGVPIWYCIPEAEALITRAHARHGPPKQGTVYEPERARERPPPEHGRVPPSVRSIIPNRLQQNSRAFQLHRAGRRARCISCRAFPVMAWPMIEWVLEQRYYHDRISTARCSWIEQSLIVFGAHGGHTHAADGGQLEREHPGIKVFSLPSVDHPQVRTAHRAGCERHARSRCRHQALGRTLLERSGTPSSCAVLALSWCVKFNALVYGASSP